MSAGSELRCPWDREQTSAYKLQKRAAEAGFDWREASAVLGAVGEELAEVREALARGSEQTSAAVAAVVRNQAGCRLGTLRKKRGCRAPSTTNPGGRHDLLGHVRADR